jgi:hypothetical protein
LQAAQQRLQAVRGLPGQWRLDEAAVFVEDADVEAPPD